MSLLYHDQGVNVPVAFQPIQKTEKYLDKKTGRERRKSVKTKNVPAFIALTGVLTPNGKSCTLRDFTTDFLDFSVR